MGARVRQEWSAEELIDSWTLLEDDRRLLRNKSGATRLAFITKEILSSWIRSCGDVGQVGVTEECADQLR